MQVPIFPHEAELKELTERLDKLKKKWYEFERISQLLRANDIDADIVISTYIERLKPLCYQGGTGHAFYYKLGSSTSPHHWVVRPEHYEQSKPSKKEAMALSFKRFYPGFYFKITKKSHIEHWGN